MTNPFTGSMGVSTSGISTASSFFSSSLIDSFTYWFTLVAAEGSWLGTIFISSYIAVTFDTSSFFIEALTCLGWAYGSYFLAVVAGGIFPSADVEVGLVVPVLFPEIIIPEELFPPPDLAVGAAAFLGADGFFINYFITIIKL